MSNWFHIFSNLIFKNFHVYTIEIIFGNILTSLELVVVGIILVEMYVKFKNMNNACNAFNNMPSCFFGMYFYPVTCQRWARAKGNRMVQQMHKGTRPYHLCVVSNACVNVVGIEDVKCEQIFQSDHGGL